MDTSPLTGLEVHASGTYPVELSVGRRVNGRHRVALTASVDVTTGEVRFQVDAAGIETLVADSS